MGSATGIRENGGQPLCPPVECRDMDGYNLISFAGIFVLAALAWALSADRRNINWRVIGWGIGLQLLIALFIFVVPAGARVFLVVNDVVVKVLDSAGEGARFVFGRLALGPGQVSKEGAESLGFMLAFQAFPTIIFFSALIAILYYVGLMPLVIKGFARVFTRLMRVSGAESLVVASNIFVGVESNLTIKPLPGESDRLGTVYGPDGGHGHRRLERPGPVRADAPEAVPHDRGAPDLGVAAVRPRRPADVETPAAGKRQAGDPGPERGAVLRAGRQSLRGDHQRGQRRRAHDRGDRRPADCGPRAGGAGRSGALRRRGLSESRCWARRADGRWAACSATCFTR